MKLQTTRALGRVSLATLISAFALSLPAMAKDLRIENKRNVALKELTIVPKAGDGSPSIVLAQNIEARRTTTGRVPAGNCLFDVKGTFADNTTLAADDMNLCAQNIIRLVE